MLTNDFEKWIVFFKSENTFNSNTILQVKFVCFFWFLDAENQRKITELSRKENELSTSIAGYKHIFTAFRELLNMLTSKIVSPF